MTGPVACVVCHAEFTPSRASQRVCGPTCRQRKHRGTPAPAPPYVVTEADRAAMRRAALAVPVPLPRLHPEDVDAYVRATARDLGELE